MSKTPLLDKITSPHQLRRLTPAQLTDLAEELRGRIIDVVSRRGGHLASNLGVAELTIALHYVFDFQHDRLLWDVGHQCYPHKLLTGRMEMFERLRQRGGMSGFPAPSESPYDLFATGHAGTAVSTAAGLAWADKALQRDTRVVSVVGDASIVNGLSFEAINNICLLQRQFLVVLNDNSMAIDRTHGALAQVLDRIRMTPTYSDLKHSAEYLLKNLPLGAEITEALRHVRDGLRTTVHGDKFFEPLGLTYFGPIDGHDVGNLISVLQRVREINYPVLLHVHTEKGRGCEYAVEDPTLFHSPSAYTMQNGRAVFADKKRPTWTKTFSEALIERSKTDERIVAITAAMPDGTGLVPFREKFPQRYIDVGICESHAVGMAAGLARAGLKPVVAVYSTFLQRGFDQVFHDVALQGLGAVFCMDRAGLVGSDGAVHHGVMDIAYLRPIPGMVLVAPADAAEMNAAMDFALASSGPVAIRYPRDEVPADLPGECPSFQPGKARQVRKGDQAALLCYGTTIEPALLAAETLAAEGVEVEVVNARFAKPLDAAVVTRLLRSGKPVLVCEDHNQIGGFGSAVLELAAARGLDASNVRLRGIPDRFIAQGSRRQQLEEVGLDAPSLIETLRDMLRDQSQPHPRDYHSQGA
ncbi:MAG: 1-deoxy-D-xylulose-5-phosphate synthase [Phycisphaerae bacterium]